MPRPAGGRRGLLRRPLAFAPCPPGARWEGRTAFKTRRERKREDGKEDLRVQGRDRRDARPRSQFALFEEGDIPARAGVQRLGRDRPGEVPRPHRQVDRRRLAGVEDPDRGECGRAHAHRLRQRHRHGRGGAGEEPRHHRELGHQEVPRDAQGEGRRLAPRADRTVRRRLLRRVHGRRPGDGGDPQARRRRVLQVGVGPFRLVFRFRRRARLPRHFGDAASAGGPGRVPRLLARLRADPQVFRLHRLSRHLPPRRRSGRRERGGPQGARGARGEAAQHHGRALEAAEEGR